MGKVKDILWEPKDFALPDGDAFDIGDPKERDIHEAISALQQVINAHLSDDDNSVMWQFQDCINQLRAML